MQIDTLVAIDVHVHLEHTGALTAADEQAQRYFGSSAAARDWNTLAEYYRSRKIGCVVFPVDEKLTGRPPVPNERAAEFAAEHSDIAIAFASIDPARGPEGVREARELIRAGGIRGLKLHPPLQQFAPNRIKPSPRQAVLAKGESAVFRQPLRKPNIVKRFEADCESPPLVCRLALKSFFRNGTRLFELMARNKEHSIRGIEIKAFVIDLDNRQILAHRRGAE